MGKLLSSDNPVGKMIAIAGGSIPPGYLPCDGSAISRTLYRDLFLAIGVAHGVGDGTTTFNLPDGRGRALIFDGTGVGLTAKVVGQKHGAETHTLAKAEMPSHYHLDGGWQVAGTPTVYGKVNDQPVGYPQEKVYSASVTAWQVLSSTEGSSTAHNNIQPSLVVKSAIKY